METGFVYNLHGTCCILLFFLPLFVLLLNCNLFSLLLYYEVAISSVPERAVSLLHTFFYRVKELIALHLNQLLFYQHSS